MKSSAVMKIEGVFNLPDEFEGTYRDALKLYLEYLMSKEYNDKNKKIEFKHLNEFTGDEVPVDMYKELWNRDDIRTIYGIQVMKYVDDDWKVLQEERV